MQNIPDTVSPHRNKNQLSRYESQNLYHRKLLKDEPSGFVLFYTKSRNMRRSFYGKSH